ncbi:MAG: hypothetical protein R3B54_07075 [Bdellovibrionota bacterium]
MGRVVEGLGWPDRFDGTSAEFKGLLSRYRQDQEKAGYRNVGSSDRPYSGEDGYIRMSEELFGGSMDRAYDAASQMGLLKDLGWPGRFRGKSSEFKEILSRFRQDQEKASYRNVGSGDRPYSGYDGYARVADELYGGDMGRAHAAASQMGRVVEGLGWPDRFDGTSAEFKGLLSRYRQDQEKAGYRNVGSSDRPYSGYDGYARTADELLKEFGAGS